MRRSAAKKSRARRKSERPDNLIRLFEIGPYDRNRVTREQIQYLRDLIDSDGGPKTAESMGISEVTMYRVAAGFAHQLRPATAQKVRAFFK
jgi:hypothetical protein